jgi:hypothetical protein
MFPNKGHYYGAIIADLFLRYVFEKPIFCLLELRIILPNRRFMWVLTLIPPSSGARFEIPQYLTAISIDFELAR